MYFIKTPFWLRLIYRSCIWRKSNQERVLYFSFDDGPHPEATPFVLEQLANFDAKASNGDTVNTNWIMTTTGINQSKGIEQRIVSAALYFNGNTDNQILIQGVAEYKITKAALDESVTTRRAIIGGTGKYANAQGWMETKHLSNGSWQHVLNLK